MITLKTATGTDKDSIKGITHQKIYLTTTRGKIVSTCINLIISEKLNELDLILGADFLFMNEKIKAISKNDLTWHENADDTYRIKIEEIKSLVDTGAANSLIQYDIAKKLGLQFEPAKITLKTATGEDKDSIKGITHQKIYLKTSKGRIVGSCVNLIVTKI